MSLELPQHQLTDESGVKASGYFGGLDLELELVLVELKGHVDFVFAFVFLVSDALYATHERFIRDSRWDREPPECCTRSTPPAARCP